MRKIDNAIKVLNEKLLTNYTEEEAEEIIIKYIEQASLFVDAIDRILDFKS